MSLFSIWDDIVVYLSRVGQWMDVFVMIRLAEIIEKETEAYYKMDPDPFDDRHPGEPFFTKSESLPL